DTHRLVFQWVETGAVTGLRVDHPDGLFDPRRYFLGLQRERVSQRERARWAAAHPAGDGDAEAAAARAGAADEGAGGGEPGRPGCRPLYVLAEKILARGERLQPRWAVYGTTGYDLVNLIGGLFVDPASARAMTAAYRGFTGVAESYPDVVYESKQLIMDAT